MGFVVPGKFISYLACAIVVCACAARATAQEDCKNVLLKDNVTHAHRQQLTESLRRITGWQQLSFDEKGALQIGSQQPEAGSSGARALLTKAMSGSRVILIEDASQRADVAFGSVFEGRSANQTKDARPWVVLIDFSDFTQVIGDKRARAAFDSGWTLLHEIEHAVNDANDSTHLEEVGDCENHINTMRRELELPERAEYFHTLFPVTGEGRNFSTVFVRLAFESRDRAGRKKQLWLMWDATVVGGVSPSAALAAVK